MRRGLARLLAVPRRALRRLLRRPPSDWAGPDEAREAVLRAAPVEADNRHDIVCFPAIGGNGHIEESVSLLRRLAEMGHRVFWLSPRFRADGRAYELRERLPRLFEVSLRGPEVDIRRELLDQAAVDLLFEALDTLRRELGLGATVCVLREPIWLAIAGRMRAERAWPLLYDLASSQAAHSEEAGGRQAQRLETGSASSSPAVGEKARLLEPHVAWLPEADEEESLGTLSEALAQAFPLISVVVVTYNNRDLNRLCLESLFARTEWPNREIIVVDNASSDGTRELLAEAAGRHPNLRVIGLEKNRGFPAASNVGLAQATGAYLVLLNNDTVVTRGWATALARHLARDPKLGLVGPVTNAIANEARVEVGYSDIADLPAWAADWVRAHDGETFPISMLAFFCVAMRRELFETVGPLDERFGLGLFEDGDYNRRARAKGWEIRCARDAFVHHWQKASFRQLGQDAYLNLFEENRKKYEEKWREGKAEEIEAGGQQ